MNNFKVISLPLLTALLLLAAQEMVAQPSGHNGLSEQGKNFFRSVSSTTGCFMDSSINFIQTAGHSEGPTKVLAGSAIAALGALIFTKHTQVVYRLIRAQRSNFNRAYATGCLLPAWILPVNQGLGIAGMGVWHMYKGAVESKEIIEKKGMNLDFKKNAFVS